LHKPTKLPDSTTTGFQPVNRLFPFIIAAARSTDDLPGSLANLSEETEHV
jgi:hypothetical protein